MLNQEIRSPQADRTIDQDQQGRNLSRRQSDIVMSIGWGIASMEPSVERITEINRGNRGAE